MNHHQLNLKRKSISAITSNASAGRSDLERENTSSAKNDSINFQKKHAPTLVDDKHEKLKLKHINANTSPTKNGKTAKSLTLSMIKPSAGMDLAKKAFVKARIRYPKRRISNENLAAVKQEMTKSMFASFVSHLSTIKFSLHAKQINLALLNHELRKFDSTLFNKLMAQVYYRQPRRSKTTSVPINNILLEALQGTLWQHACKLTNAAFLNSTLLYLLACLDTEKADKVHKEILSQAKQ